MTGEEWVAQYCAKQGYDWDTLSPGIKASITREIPCSVRCWRVGEPVDSPPGSPCVECGRPVPVPSAWERLRI